MTKIGVLTEEYKFTNVELTFTLENAVFMSIMLKISKLSSFSTSLSFRKVDCILINHVI